MYSHHRHKPTELDKLWVVTVVINPQRYRSRYDLFQRFRQHMANSHVNLLVVEVAFGSRPFEVTSADNPFDAQLRTTTEMWHKENALNLGIQRLPADWKYVAWIDADVEFMRQDWAEEIVQQLQHYHVIQLFQNAVDLGPNGEAKKIMDGFVYSWVNGLPGPFTKGSYGPYYHPGYAWAARREAIDGLGGLMDFPILGAADHHMAWALVGKVVENSPTKISPAYKKHLIVWQKRALTHVRKNIGFMPGTIYHHFHGAKKNRKYVERWQILFKHNYDPEWDIQRDSQGLYVLSDQGLRLRNDLRSYFANRLEDQNCDCG